MARRKKKLAGCPIVKHVRSVRATPLLTIQMEDAGQCHVSGALVRYQPTSSSTEAELLAFEAQLERAGAIAWRRMPRPAPQGAPAAPEMAGNAPMAASLRQRCMRYAERLRGARDTDALKGALDGFLTEVGL